MTARGLAAPSPVQLVRDYGPQRPEARMTRFRTIGRQIVDAQDHVPRDITDVRARGGIVHRDLKPGNVMLLPDGTVKILDFGLAKMRDQRLSGDSARMGTVAYMAPEQIQGEPVDARTDLWALGVVLHEMLAGRTAFVGEHELAIAHAILHEEPARLAALRPEVPAAVEQIILTLLEKRPTRRYVTAEALLNTLNDTRAIQQHRITPLWRRLSPSGRRRMLGAAAAAVAMSGVLFLLSRSGDSRAATLSPVVVMPFENRSTDRDLDALGAMVADWVAQGLTEAGFLTVLDSRSALAAAHVLGSAAAPVAVGRETGAGVVVTGSYFLQSDSLQFQTQIASTAAGSILFGIGGVAAPRDRPLGGPNAGIWRVGEACADWSSIGRARSCAWATWRAP